MPALTAAVPYQIHTVLTDSSTHFTDPSGCGTVASIGQACGPIRWKLIAGIGMHHTVRHDVMREGKVENVHAHFI